MMPSSPDTSAREFRGVVLAKQFPNPKEPLRGLFVLDQVRAAHGRVEWSVIAPVPYVPKLLSGVLHRPYIKGSDTIDSIDVFRPRYPVLPRRTFYSSVGRAMGFSARRPLRTVLRTGRVDFVHAHALYPSASAAAFALGSAAVPLIVTVHGSDLYTNIARSGWKRQLEIVIGRAERIVTVSQRLRTDLLSEFDVAPDKVTVIPDTYDETRFSLVKRTDPAGRPIRFLSVGNLREVKGHDVLIQAFGRAVERGLDAELTIVGGGALRASLSALATTVPGSDRIRITGALGGDALVTEYERADAFVLASRSEGFGVVYVEALATGLPVVATRCGGPEDIVTDKDGLLVDVEDVPSLADALIKLADDIGDYDAQDIALRAHDRFCSATVGAQLVELYGSVVGAAQ